MKLLEMPFEKNWPLPKTTTQDSLFTLLAENQYAAITTNNGITARFIRQGGVCAIQIPGRKDTIVDLQDKLGHLYHPFRSFFKKDTVIIGELCCDGVSAKELLDMILIRMAGQVYFSVHDVWYSNGLNLMDQGYTERIKNLILPPSRFIKKAPISPQATEALLMLPSGKKLLFQNAEAIPSPGEKVPYKIFFYQKEEKKEVRAFIGDFIYPDRDYLGTDLDTHPYWENLMSGEKTNQNKIKEYEEGLTWEPISEGYYLHIPKAITCYVYKADQILPVTIAVVEDAPQEIFRNPEKYRGKVVSLVDFAFDENYQLEHARIKFVLPDALSEECTFENIFN